MIRTRGAAALLTIALAALGLVVLAAPAQAAAPVTGPDSAAMYAGNTVEVQLLLNDTDADGDDLAVCRLADSTHKKVDLFFGFTEEGEQSDETVLISTHPGAKPGTYTFTYYACDIQTLVPGTITLTIHEKPKVKVKALPGKPGKIKVKNPADFKILFLYGSFKQDSPDGEAVIPRGSSVILEVQRTQIDWIAVKKRGYQFLTKGRLKGITLPPDRTPPSSDSPTSPRLGHLWSR